MPADALGSILPCLPAIINNPIIIWLRSSANDGLLNHISDSSKSVFQTAWPKAIYKVSKHSVVKHLKGEDFGRPTKACK